jgi:hypothetical protein
MLWIKSLLTIGLSAISWGVIMPLGAIAQTTDAIPSETGIPIPVEQPPLETPGDASTPDKHESPSNLLNLSLGQVGSIGISLNLDPNAIGGLINFARQGEPACRVGEFNTARRSNGTIEAEVYTGDAQAQCQSSPGLGFRFDVQPDEDGVAGSFSLGDDRDGNFQILLP